MATVNKLPKSSDGQTVTHLVDSQVFDNGTNVGVGTTTPGAKLDANGEVRSSSAGDGFKAFGSNANNFARLFMHGSSNYVSLRSQMSGQNAPIYLQQSDGTNLNTRVAVDPNGLVGVGLINPGAKFEVAGDMRIGDGAGSISVVVALPPSGDTSGTTDRQNIQAAIEAVATNGGGTVVLQKNQYPYYVNQSGANLYAILLEEGVHLAGCSMYGCGISACSGGISVIQVNNPASSYGTFVIKDLVINGNGQSSVIGINLIATADSSPQPALVENVVINDCAKGIKVESWFTEIDNCYIRNCGTGIDLVNDDSAPHYETNSTLVSHCNIWGSSTGIRMEGQGNVVTGCDIGILANGYGIDIEETAFGQAQRLNYIAGNYIEATDGNNVNVTGIYVNCAGSVIIGNFFDIIGTGGQNISIASGKEAGVTVIGNCNDGTEMPAQFHTSVGIGTTSPASGLHVGADAGGPSKGYLTLEKLNASHQPSSGPGTGKCIIYFGSDGILWAWKENAANPIELA